MRRAGIRWAALAVVVAAAILALLWGRHRQPPVRPVLSLRVNRGSSARIVAGTPLTFEVFLTATGTGRAISIGSALSPWYRGIRVEPGDSSSSMPWTATRLGVPRSTVYAKDRQGRPAATLSASPPAAALQGLGAVHVVALGVSPEESARAAAGVYRVRAVLSHPWWMFWSRFGSIASAPVTIAVSSGGDAAEAHQRRRETAAFYLAAGRYADAQQSALAWAQAEPGSSDAYAILGEAREAQADPIGAMDAYRQALQLRPPSPEPPEYLERRLDALMRKTRRME